MYKTGAVVTNGQTQRPKQLIMDFRVAKAEDDYRVLGDPGRAVCESDGIIQIRR